MHEDFDNKTEEEEDSDQENRNNATTLSAGVHEKPLEFKNSIAYFNDNRETTVPGIGSLNRIST